MNVTLPPELEQYVAGKVATGLYPTPSDVIREALAASRAGEERVSKLDALQSDLDVGLTQLEAGQGRPGSAVQTLAEIRTRRGE